MADLIQILIGHHRSIKVYQLLNRQLGNGPLILDVRSLNNKMGSVLKTLDGPGGHSA